MQKESVTSDDISYDYHITKSASFYCECLSKQLLHGINPMYKSRARGQDHSYCAFVHITGTVITSSSVLQLTELSHSPYP